MKKGCSAALALTAALYAGRAQAQEPLRLPKPVPDQPAATQSTPTPASPAGSLPATPLLTVGGPGQPEPGPGPSIMEIWDHANGWVTITPPHLWPRHELGLHDNCASSCLYAEGEYLLWWVRSPHLPALATAGLATDPAPAVLGQSGTSVVLGGTNIDQEVFSGGRFTVGSWLGQADLLAVESVFMFLGDRSNQSPTVSSSGNSAVLGMPIINPATGAETIEPIASPNQQSGAIRYSYKTELWGTETNFKTLLASGCWYRTELLAGFRFLDLQERLRIGQSESFAPAGSDLSAVINDSFETTNRFYGGQIGAKTHVGWKCWTLDFTTKVALGGTAEITRIDGTTQLFSGMGSPTVLPGGILAAPSNSGRFRSAAFSCVPETGISLGWQITDHLKAHVGYNYLCWTSVARPGDQVDRMVNVSQLPTLNGPGVLVGPAKPAVLFDRTTFWAQGMDIGFELAF